MDYTHEGSEQLVLTVISPSLVDLIEFDLPEVIDTRYSCDSR